MFFNIDEIREKQKIATENAIKEQNKTISSAQEEQRRKIEKREKDTMEKTGLPWIKKYIAKNTVQEKAINRTKH